MDTALYIIFICHKGERKLGLREEKNLWMKNSNRQGHLKPGYLEVKEKATGKTKQTPDSK